MNKRIKAFGALTIAAALTLSACGSSSGGKTVSIAGFSVLQQPNAAVIDGFLKTSAGKGLSSSDFKQSYGASGDERDSVLQGAPVDEVHLSLEPDVTKLVSAGIVPSNWNQGTTKGICTQSVVVFVVKKGNPLGIHTWADLVNKDVKIVTPDPSSSGSAKWNLLAAYGSAFASGSGSQSAGEAYLKKFYSHVATQPSSSRDATTAFETGKYDVLLSYENEAIAARAAGQDFDYVIPDSTLLIQNPCALTKNAGSTAKSFLAYQESKAGQTIYAENGFRPLPTAGVGTVTVKGAENASDPYPAPTKLENITDSEFLGGWDKANDFFFGDGISGDTLGLVTAIQKGATS